jgi:hypothetical protein
MKSSSTVRMLIIGIVILAPISASAMAISKSDLISSYQSQSGPGYTKPVGSDTSSKPTTSPAWPSPTPTPVPSRGRSLFPSWFSPSPRLSPFDNVSPYVKPAVYPTPTISTEDTGGYIPCPPAVPVGSLTPCFCSCMSYKNAVTGEVSNTGCINPETEHSYPIAVDILGNAYLIKPGCTARWP